MKTRKFNTATNRPQRGSLLFAHTLACLEVLGMLKSKPENRNAVRPGTITTLMGATALRHHTKSTGAFGRDEEGRVTLTNEGLVMFAGRAARLNIAQREDQIADSKQVKAMADALRHGGTVEGVRFNNEVEVAIG